MKSRWVLHVVAAMLIITSSVWPIAQAHPTGIARAATPKVSAEIKARVECSAMAGKVIPAGKIALPTGGATITSAEMNSGSGQEGTPDFVPAYCEIKGAIAPVDPSAPPINFGVDIPANWNGKAIHIGGNGMDGFVPWLAALSRGTAGSPLGPAFPPDAAYPIAKGYATFGSDSGHGGANAPGQPGGPPAGEAGRGPGRGAGGGQRGPDAGRGGAAGATPQGPPPGLGFGWMGNRESLKNFSYEQIKKTHDVAMEILLQMYGTKPKYTYFMGESQGGREALMAVAHYPEDYDGVSSSVGLIYFTGILLSPQYRTKIQIEPGAWVPPAKAAAIRDEVLRQCDSLDGLADGVINNYAACNRLMDPTITPNPLAKIRCAGGADTGNDCLSDAQMATINAFHSPMKWGFAMANGETDWPSEPAGSEGPMGWLLTGNQPSASAPPAGGAGGILGSMFGDPDKYNLMTHSFLDLKDQIQELSGLIDVPTDWSKFFAHGGKLIMHSAGNDYVTNPRVQMRMYDTVVKRFGQAKVDKTVRYYVTPNAGHGSVGISATTGAPQARYMDLVDYLENWVENGVTPPETIPQKLMDTKAPYAVIRSRPLCRYPKYPHYNGSGDPDKMESYSCTAP